MWQKHGSNQNYWSQVPVSSGRLRLQAKLPVLQEQVFQCCAMLWHDARFLMYSHCRRLTSTAQWYARSQKQWPAKPLKFGSVTICFWVSFLGGFLTALIKERFENERSVGRWESKDQILAQKSVDFSGILLRYKILSLWTSTKLALTGLQQAFRGT